MRAPGDELESRTGCWVIGDSSDGVDSQLTGIETSLQSTDIFLVHEVMIITETSADRSMRMVVPTRALSAKNIAVRRFQFVG